MGFDPNDDPENDLPEWLRGVQPEDENGGFEPDDSISSDSEEDLPNWMQKDEQGSFQPPETRDEEDTPDWLSNIRNQENSRREQETPDFSEDEDDNLDWLESLGGDAEPDEEPGTEEDPAEFLDKIQELKARDQDEGSWGEEEDAQQEWELEEEDDEIAAAWKRESGTLNLSEEDEDEIPDWVSGLPSLDPAELPAPRDTGSGEPQEEEDEIPEWLTDIRQKTSEDTKQPEEVLPAFGIEPDELYEAESEEDEPVQFEADEETADEEPFDAVNEESEVVENLPSWLENLSTNALVESTEEAAEDRLNTAAYVEDEDVSALFEGDDLPDWLDEVAEEEEEPEEETVEEALPEQVPALDEEIQKGELPSWLQAMRPVEAVTSSVEETEDEDGEEHEQETVGPLSGLRDVLPAEPHIIHFGSKPKLSAGFELTGAQKQYAELLKSQVKQEGASIPAKRRSVANPQQVFRWIIAILLLTITFSVLWWNGNILALPSQTAIPGETFAALNLVNQIQAGEKVLVAFEYQPGLSAELEAASASLLDDLIGSGAELVLVSSQPVGPGLAESFLNSQLSGWPYISEGRYANLGYISGGAAGLLNFAINPRNAKPEMAWSQSPLDTINNMMDFAMVLVITDDPDVARSWVEQVQPLMDVGGSEQAVPMVMVVSAQAEPLVYPYYYTTPRQVSGLVSGVSGGAFYESYHGESLARRYWDAYNIGLVLAVLVIAGGSIFNLTRTPLNRTGKGRS